MNLFALNLPSVRKALALFLVVPGLISIQGCTDEEVLATVGVIAVVGGAVAIGVAASNNNDNKNHHNNHHYRPRPPYGHRPPGYGGYGRPPRPWGAHRMSLAQENTQLVTPLSQLTSADELNAVSLVSQRYQLPLSSAAALQLTLKKTVESQSLNPLFELGLTRSDLLDIGQYKMISNTGLRNVAQKLEISEDQAKNVVQQMIKDAKQNPSASTVF